MLESLGEKYYLGSNQGQLHGCDTCAVALGPALKEDPHLVKCSTVRVFKFFIFEQGI